MKRRNFSRSVSVEIIKRATVNGQLICEKCGLPCKSGEIHHLTMDAMEVDKSRKLTAADGQLWCKPCHKVETAKQRPVLAKAQAVEAAHLGVKSPHKRPIQSRGFPHKPKREAKASLAPRRLYEDAR